MFFRHRAWRVANDNKTVYLTFDDGPVPEATPWILELLKEKGMKATFFCVGDNVRKHPEIFEQILSEGHAVGNHTMRHEKGIVTEESSYLDSVDEASKYIESSLFRPPYGRMTWKQSRVLRKKFRIIMWTWLSYDYDQNVPTLRIIHKAEKEIRSGDIVVFHDNMKSFDRLKEILPEVLNDLEKKGLKALPISL
jgi:peptidoglycan/xylan/chitin deacetylase (PgdA/CDA1 family)